MCARLHLFVAGWTTATISDQGLLAELRADWKSHERQTKCMARKDPRGRKLRPTRDHEPSCPHLQKLPHLPGQTTPVERGTMEQHQTCVGCLRIMTAAANEADPRQETRARACAALEAIVVFTQFNGTKHASTPTYDIKEMSRTRKLPWTAPRTPRPTSVHNTHHEVSLLLLLLCRGRLRGPPGLRQQPSCWRC